MTDMDMKLKYVLVETLPSGNVRYRFRRAGVKVSLKGSPGSPEFLAHYARLLKNESDSPVATAVTGSITWGVGRYLADLEQRVTAGLSSPLTLKGHRHHLGRLVAKYGAKDLNIPRGKLVELRDELAATPGAADNLLKATSALYKWLIERDLVHISNPTRDITRLNRKSKGFPPWERSDFDNYFKAHPPGTMAHRALLLAISTTARRGDIVRLGPVHEEMKNGRQYLTWIQDKAPHREISLPMSKALIADVRPRSDVSYLKSEGAYLLTEHGRPFKSSGFGNKFRNWCDTANVSKSLHGVRKGVATLLPGKGATSLELDVLLGHEMNSDETKTYVVDAKRDDLAQVVVDRIDRISF